MASYLPKQTFNSSFRTGEARQSVNSSRIAVVAKAQPVQQTNSAKTGSGTTIDSSNKKSPSPAVNIIPVSRCESHYAELLNPAVFKRFSQFMTMQVD
jgi:hypothetical protein